MTDSLEEKKYQPLVDVEQGSVLPVLHANQMLVQHTEHELVVTFFEVLPSLSSGGQAQRDVDDRELQPLESRPVARIVMSSLRAREFAVALAESLRFVSVETDPTEYQRMLTLENQSHPEIEPEEQWLVRSGTLQKLMASASQQQPMNDWERFLDEL